MTKKIKVIIYFILSVLFISPSVSDENLNEYEINFYSGMFDFSDDGQRALLFGLQHQNENLTRESFLGKVSPVTGFLISSAITLPNTLSDKLTSMFPPSIISEIVTDDLFFGSHSAIVT